MTTQLPAAPQRGRTGLRTVPATGPVWRIWHPTAHTTAANIGRSFGPLHRFDPHPAGPPAVSEKVVVLYCSLAFEVSALGVFRRAPVGGPAVVDICPNWRGSLVSVPAGARLFDLTSSAAAAEVGATPRLGDANLDDTGYATTQAWARFFHTSAGVHGLRYLSCRAADRGGIATVAFRKAAIGSVGAQHLLLDDALWPYLVYTLDAVGVAVNRVPDCPRCLG